jgi:hypothetical protein
MTISVMTKSMMEYTACLNVRLPYPPLPYLARVSSTQTRDDDGRAPDLGSGQALNLLQRNDAELVNKKHRQFCEQQERAHMQ